MGNFYINAGDFGAGIDYLNQALVLHRQAGDKLNESGTLANVGFVAMALGDYAAAQEQFAQALGQSAAIGQRKNEGLIRVNLAMVLLNQGRSAAAHGEAFQALGLLRSSGNRWGEAAALRVVGQACRALGDWSAAADHFIASRDLFDQLEMPHLAIEAMAQLAVLMLARGESAQALAITESILARQSAGAVLDGTDEPMRIRLACWQVLQAVGDARADGLLDLSWQELRERADRIGDERRRHAFLQAVPFHGEIVAAWNARRQAAAVLPLAREDLIGSRSMGQ
jgi:tetratricopeptide (TPR) repeat protein